MKQTIFLLRHGEPRFPDERQYIYGHTDWPLSDEGVLQARRAASALAAVRLDRIFSSDLSRALQTAEIAAEAQSAPPKVEADKGLREVFMGEWEGRAYDDVRCGVEEMVRRRTADGENVSAPGGETFAELQARAWPAFDRLVSSASDASNVLVSAHGGTLWTIVSHIFGLPLGGMRRYGLDFCAIHVLEHATDTGDWKFIRYNWSPELTGWQAHPTERKR